MLTAQEIAGYLKINEKKVYALIAEKGLPATKVTGKWLFSRQLVDQWLLAHTRNVPSEGEQNKDYNKLLIITGSNDILLDRLLFYFNQKQFDEIVVFGNTGSMNGINTLQENRCDIATSHLIQDDEKEYNFAFIGIEFDPPPVIINFCYREQGLLVPAENPKKINQTSDLSRSGITIVNRAQGTGTRLLFDRELQKAGINGESIKGYHDILGNHLDVGLHIFQGMADAAPGIRPVASLLGLGFIPFRWERYDFLVNRERFFSKKVQLFLGLLNESFFREMATGIPGYDISSAGRMVYPQESLIHMSAPEEGPSGD